MRKLLAAMAVASVVGLMASAANATITFTLGNHPQPDEENILFQVPLSGTRSTAQPSPALELFSPR
jgi:hypothetical protein